MQKRRGKKHKTRETGEGKRNESDASNYEQRTKRGEKRKARAKKSKNQAKDMRNQKKTRLLHPNLRRTRHVVPIDVVQNHRHPLSRRARSSCNSPFLRNIHPGLLLLLPPLCRTSNNTDRTRPNRPRFALILLPLLRRSSDAQTGLLLSSRRLRLLLDDFGLELLLLRRVISSNEGREKVPVVLLLGIEEVDGGKFGDD